MSAPDYEAVKRTSYPGVTRLAIDAARKAEEQAARVRDALLSGSAYALRDAERAMRSARRWNLRAEDMAKDARQWAREDEHDVALQRVLGRVARNVYEASLMLANARTA